MIELFFMVMSFVVTVIAYIVRGFVTLLVTVPQYIGATLGYALYCMIIYSVYNVNLPWYIWILGIIPTLLITKVCTIFKYTHRGIMFFAASSIAYTIYYLSELIPWPSSIIRLVILVVAEIGFCVYTYFLSDIAVDDRNNPFTLILSSVLFALGNAFIVSGFFEVLYNVDDAYKYIIVFSIILAIVEAIISFMASRVISYTDVSEVEAEL